MAAQYLQTKICCFPPHSLKDSLLEFHMYSIKRTKASPNIMIAKIEPIDVSTPYLKVDITINYHPPYSESIFPIPAYPNTIPFLAFNFSLTLADKKKAG